MLYHQNLYIEHDIFVSLNLRNCSVWISISLG